MPREERSGRRDGRRGGANRRVRLTEPLVRVDGVLRPTSWDAALDRAATGLADVRERHGSGALGMFSCSKASNETNYLAQKFARVALGTNNIDSCNRT
jgi:formate dehydrogenase (hydrogenase)